MRVLHSLCGAEVEQELDEGRQQSIIEAIRQHHQNSLFDYLANAEHSQAQSEAFLKRRHLHPQLAQEIIERAKELNFLSDRRFAEIYLRSLLEGGKSRRYIISKLRQHGIKENIYTELFAEYYSRDRSLETLKEMIGSLLFKYRELAPAKALEKVYAALYRKGWDLDDISAAWHALKAD